MTILNQLAADALGEICATEFDVAPLGTISLGASQLTEAMNRYPRLGTVSRNLGWSRSSASAARRRFRAALRLPSKSTLVPSGQSSFCNSSRVTISPGRSRSMARIRNGWSCSLTRTPARVSKPRSRSTSNSPNRQERLDLTRRRDVTDGPIVSALKKEDWGEVYTDFMQTRMPS